MWGNTGPLWRLCNKFLPLWLGKCRDFASVQLRGDWDRSIVRSSGEEEGMFFQSGQISNSVQIVKVSHVDFFKISTKNVNF